MRPPSDRFDAGHKRRELEDRIAAVQRRKVEARHEGERSTWFGLGMFGLVGWSVTIPTVAGIAIGLWIDTHTASPYSWTLMGLFTGLVAGCIMAWNWVKRESEDE